MKNVTSLSRNVTGRAEAHLCECGCSRLVVWNGLGRRKHFYNASCRKRVNRGKPVSFVCGYYWREVFDGDPKAFELFYRHYPAVHYQDGRREKDKRFAGIGEKLVLVLPDYSALFVWRLSDPGADGQEGLCCSVFRNESRYLSSDLIYDAEFLASVRFPGQSRYYTYVNPVKVSSPNPGYCFKMAGWVTIPKRSERRGLHILEKQVR